MLIRLFLMLLLWPVMAQADAVQRLHDFFRNTTSMRADFYQVVFDNQGRKVQEVKGVMQLQRPGKFRWDYKQPYVQLVVGDGEKVWLYDPELEQVTVRALGKVLGASRGQQGYRQDLHAAGQGRKGCPGVGGGHPARPG